MQFQPHCARFELFLQRCRMAGVALAEKAEIDGQPFCCLQHPPQVPRPRRTGGCIGAGCRTGAAPQHGGHTGHQCFLNLLWADEMNMAIDAAGSGNQPLSSDRLGAGTDDDVNARLNIGIAGFANAGDASILDADISLDDAPVIDDQRIGDHGIDRAITLRPLRLTHAIADHLAAAEFHFLAVNRMVTLDFDPQFGIAQPHPVAGGRAIHLGIGATIDAAHGCFSSGPITSARKPCTSRAPA